MDAGEATDSALHTSHRYHKHTGTSPLIGDMQNKVLKAICNCQALL